MLTIEEFVQNFTPAVRKWAAEWFRRYRGWFSDHREDLKDLIGVGMLELVIIYPKVDFQNEGWKTFVKTGINNALRNDLNKYLKKNFPPIKTEKQGKVIEIYQPKESVDDLEEALEDTGVFDTEMTLLRNCILGAISLFMKECTPKERFMLISYFCDKISYQKIGECVGNDRETVSKRIKKLLKKLGNILEKECGCNLCSEDKIENLREYLENDVPWMIIETGS
ncbi:MAG: sigma-70 family RNA polymerase sigma factor [Desulfobacterales bacterium]|nr:sigma-70 family RNA polymerase sigma factor [Desulfobacterales bacterium]